MVDLLLVRRLANVGKRMVRSPKVYVRDSGLVHALAGEGAEPQLLPDCRRRRGRPGADQGALHLDRPLALAEKTS
jgi:predicted AAA+ superfamily ATPase